MQINNTDVLNFQFYEYGEAFYGSFQGMCYRIARNPLENVHFTPIDKREPATFLVNAWRGPLNFETTEEPKQEKEFPYSEEGKEQAVAWLNIVHSEMFA